MDISKVIKIMLLNRNVKQIELSEKIGYTKQGLNNLLKKNDYKIKDIIKIANLLNYNVKITFIDNFGKDDITIDDI